MSDRKMTAAQVKAIRVGQILEDDQALDIDDQVALLGHGPATRQSQRYEAAYAQAEAEYVAWRASQAVPK